jgi:hypothetical protein
MTITRKYHKNSIGNGDFLPNIGMCINHYLQLLVIEFNKNNFKINLFPIFPIVYNCTELFKKKHYLLNKFKEFRYFYKNPIYLMQLNLFPIFCKITKANMLLYLNKKNSIIIIETFPKYYFKYFQIFKQIFFHFSTKIKIFRKSKKIKIYVNFKDES